MDNKAANKTDNKDKILAFIRKKGPSGPAEISKEIGKDTLITSSILSELSSKGELKISHVKFGSGPFYYLANQKGLLERISKHLNEKDLRAYEMLKDHKVIRDSELNPLQKVSMSSIKDYAVPLKVTINQKVEIFWKYYMLTNEESTQIIKDKYFPKPKSKPQPAPKPTVKKETVKQKPVSKPPSKPLPKPAPKPIPKPTTKAPTKSVQTKIKPSDEPKKTEQKEEKQRVFGEIELKGEFLSKVSKKFDELRILVLDLKVIRKNREADMVVKVPSTVGKLEFFVKAKSKKRVSDGDLSSAYIGGQTKKLPVLFVTNGKLTKKAEEMYQKEFRNNFTIVKI